MNSSTSVRNNIYLLTLQANCDKENTQRRRNHSWVVVFLRESQAKVMTNQSTLLQFYDFKTKANDRVASPSPPPFKRKIIFIALEFIIFEFSATIFNNYSTSARWIWDGRYPSRPSWL